LLSIVTPTTQKSLWKNWEQSTAPSAAAASSKSGFSQYENGASAPFFVASIIA
jgi:hypothetical protein